MSDRTESQHPPRIVYLTAGAAGMYCGSCMHDNALAKSLRRRGIDCVLQPVYTPIRTDEESVANQTVFFGGIQIYLLSRFGWLRRVPSGLRRWLDHPKVLRWATRKSRATDAAQLGDLAVSMLRGEHGDQVDEVARLTDWLADEVHPDVIVLTNLLIGGVLPTIRKRLPGVKVIVLLQGDDIFLDHLPAKQRKEAVALCAELTSLVDRFVVNSDFYAKKMLVLLGIDPSQIVIHPLTIDLQPFENASEVSG
ncbi:MAG: glycosyltransferase family 1 protein, partial [Planctomycetota bacterium]